MMTTNEIDALSDAELVRDATLRIMDGRVWWEDAMRAKGWRFCMGDQQASVMFSTSNTTTTYGYFSREAKYEPTDSSSQRRAVLRAALAAMEATP